LGSIIEIRSGFPALQRPGSSASRSTGKGKTKYCGESGVLGDLGMHVLHVPLRMGWKPELLFANLQKIVTERPDGKGGMAECDTWNNAILNTQVTVEWPDMVPMTLRDETPGTRRNQYLVH
jgi:hypothetical protein